MSRNFFFVIIVALLFLNRKRSGSSHNTSLNHADPKPDPKTKDCPPSCRACFPCHKKTGSS